MSRDASRVVGEEHQQRRRHGIVGEEHQQRRRRLVGKGRTPTTARCK
jgi:hypothetical protein